MPYEYVDPQKETNAHALPDVEVWLERDGHGDKGYFYAFGFPGCLWDSDPVGPFPT